MRIGIDGRELLHKRTGVGRVLAELCGEWLTSDRAREHEFLLYSPESGTDPSILGPPFSESSNHRFHHHSVPGRPGTWWEQVSLCTAARADGLDLFFAPAYSAPLRLTVPTVVTMHDVSFIAHPEWFGWREGLRRRWLAERVIARADAIISVSAFTRAEILQYYDGVTPERVRVVRSGITPRPTPATDRDSPPSVLFVGSIFNRRHLPTLIRAFADARRTFPTAQLTVVGDNRTFPRQDLASSIRQAGVEDSVSMRSYVSESELSELYRRATVFVFLSEYEGFGLTPLEAMSAGVPVVVADTTVARELYGDAALFVPVADATATAAAIRTLLADQSVRDQQRQRAAALLPAFTWTRAADETLDVFRWAAAARKGA